MSVCNALYPTCFLNCLPEHGIRSGGRASRKGAKTQRARQELHHTCLFSCCCLHWFGVGSSSQAGRVTAIILYLIRVMSSTNRKDAKGAKGAKSGHPGKDSGSFFSFFIRTWYYPPAVSLAERAMIGWICADGYPSRNREIWQAQRGVV